MQDVRQYILYIIVKVKKECDTTLYKNTRNKYWTAILNDYSPKSFGCRTKVLYALVFNC